MRIYFSLIFLFIGSLAYAQPGMNYSTTNKKAIKLYETGKSHYNLLEFEQAIVSLDGSILKDPNFIEAHLLLSQIYNESNQLDKAIVSLQQAVKIDPMYFPAGNYFLGEMYLSKGNYNEAYAYFMQYLDSSPRDKQTISRANLGVDCCKFADEAIKNPIPFDPINLGDKVNSANNEYYPCLTADEQSLLFTREIKNSQAYRGSHEDFFVSDKMNNKWDEPYNVREINTLYNEGAPTLSPDGQVLIFTACESIDETYGPGRNGLGSCDLFFAQKSGNQWSQAQNLGEKINTGYWESQPSFSADGLTLYFVRGKYGPNGIGKQDIYSSKLIAGQWQKAKKIKGLVNTEFEEESVMIHPDGKTLYFSSNGHVGLGGLDIFMSNLQEDGTWGKPINLGYPINTFNNENSLLVNAQGNLAYFASNREGGYGGLDLYHFELPESVRPTPVTFAKGVVFDILSYKKLGARFELIDLETGQTIIESYSDFENGEFLVCLPIEKDYALNVSKDGYLFYSENFSLKNHDPTKSFALEIPLSKIRVGNSIVLNNVFFDSNKYELKPASKAELDKLATFLIQNPKLVVEISGHTDDVGSDSDNLTLSSNRAKSVVSYLVKMGASNANISAKGYGEAKPIADNNTDEGKAKNRRTEFRILEKGN